MNLKNLKFIYKHSFFDMILLNRKTGNKK